MCDTAFVCDNMMCDTALMCDNMRCDTSLVCDTMLCDTTLVCDNMLCATTLVCDHVVCGTTLVCVNSMCGATLACAQESIISVLSSEYNGGAARPLNSILSCEKIKQTFGVNLPVWEVYADKFLKEWVAGQVNAA